MFQLGLWLLSQNGTRIMAGRESDENWSRLDSFYDPQINPLLGAGGANELASGALNETAVQFAKPLIKLIDCKNKWENE